jgi:hypothetical protein
LFIFDAKENIMKILLTILKPFKLAMALVLLFLFYIIETILMVLYVSVEYPLSFLLNKTERVIKYLIKNI